MEQINPKIAIIGYGKMGKCIEDIAIKNNMNITDIFDIDNMLCLNKIYDFDVAIDFSTPDSIMEHISILNKMKKNIVIGTTGWYDNLKQVEEDCKKSGNGVVWASNFSIGIQIFSKLAKEVALLINKFEGYDIFMSELHHNNKIDSPSGTAKTIANIILENNNRKTKINTELLNRKIEPNELHISSLRGGNIFGIHTVFVDSENDTIEIQHTAKNRNGLATGAILAAKWIYNKTGFYNFADILDNILYK